MGPWGHSISNLAVDGTVTGFWDVFQRLGGVASLGYPKTEARLDSGAPGTLFAPGAQPEIVRQYFQAAVFEFHPGDPPHTSLMLLGDRLRDQRYPNAAWEALPAFAPSDELSVGSARDIGTTARVGPAARDVESLVDFVQPSLARVSSDETACGSGFFVTRTGELVTNWHVVDTALNVTVMVPNGDVLPARILAGDPKHDLALVQVPG